MCGLLKYDVGVGAVAGAYARGISAADGCFYFKLPRARSVGRCLDLRRDVFERCGECLTLYSAYGDGHGHSHSHHAHVCLIDVALEYQIAHVGHGGDGRTVVHGVAHDDGVAHLDGNVEYDAVDGGANEGRRVVAARGRYTLSDDLHLVARCALLLLGLLESFGGFLVVFGADELVVIELVGAGKVFLGLCEADVGYADAIVSSVELLHARYHLDAGDDVSCLHFVSRLLKDGGDDAVDLWLYLHFVAREHRSARDIRVGCSLYFVGGGGLLRFVVQENEGTDKYGGNGYNCHYF